MKKLFASLLLTGLCALASAETIYRGDFSGNSVKPLRVWGKVENGMLTANGRYDFAGMLLNPSAKDLKISCTFKTEGDAAFGLILNAIQNGRATKKLLSVTWNVKSPAEKTFSWTINAKYLKKSTFLYLYCINAKKGAIHIKDFKIETVSSDANAAIPDLLFYQSDFRKSAAPFYLWGSKLENGMLNTNKKYDFGGIILPASKQPYSVTCTVKCEPGTALGIILFEEKNRKPVKRLHSVKAYLLAGGKETLKRRMRLARSVKYCEHSGNGSAVVSSECRPSRTDKVTLNISVNTALVHVPLNAEVSLAHHIGVPLQKHRALTLAPRTSSRLDEHVVCLVAIALKTSLTCKLAEIISYLFFLIGCSRYFCDLKKILEHST